MTAFIDAHCNGYGVEPICQVLPIVRSTYDESKDREVTDSRCAARVRRDRQLGEKVRRVWEELPSLQGAKGPATAPPRGHRGGSIHGGAPNVRARLSRCGAGLAGEDDDPGSEA